MSYLLTLHQDATVTLATTDRTVSAPHVQALETALDLAAALQTLTASARDASAQAQEAAREQGLRDGYVAGLAQARQEAVGEIATTLQSLAQQQQHQREELRSALVTLATAMVRCMASALAPDQVVTALALQAFEQVVPPQPVRLRLPAELVEPVRAQLAMRELPMPVQCLADTELHGLDCVVESQAGALLAGLDTVLESAAQRLETSQRQMAAPEPRAA
jgi:type III secretion protein L